MKSGEVRFASRKTVVAELGFLHEALRIHGLIHRGIASHEGQSVLLIGHAGSSIWPHFTAWLARQNPPPENPLDKWSKQIITAAAIEIGGQAVFPSDNPYLPFQQWAMEAEGLRPSPLGILSHPVYGLWHAYRAQSFCRMRS